MQERLIELGMKKHIHFTWIWIAAVLLAVIVACNPPKGKEVEPKETPIPELAAIDSLMWRQPDSAFAMLQEFVVSPEAKDLDEFNGHYCQLLISELLFKKDYEQSNREALLEAVVYFDSLILSTHGVPQQERNVFLNARVHYINGVGFYEKGDVVNACAEYLKTLEVMEAYFQEKELVKHKARFMAYTYNRLMELFSEQFMMDPAIECGEKALMFCKIEPTSSEGIPNTLYRLGKQYDKMHDIDKARLYYDQALKCVSNSDNIVYRDIVSSKALCDYKAGVDVKPLLDELKHILSSVGTENELLHRYLTIGGIYFYEDDYDSALYYLEPVFENHEAGLQDQAANYLYIVYDKLGNKEQSDSLVHYLTSRKKLVGENKALVSRLEDLYKKHSNQKLKRQAEVEREESVKRVKSIIIPTAVVVLLVVVCVLILRSKKLLKKQQDKADRVLGEAEQEHERELRLWQAEADKVLEETKKKYEEELRQLKAETEQRLEDVERKHQQWMAEAKERHEEELRTQKDRSEKEIEKTKKRHVKELEAERLAYEKEQDALKRNLKEREAQVIALENTLTLQQKAAKQRRVAFLNEPICQHILDKAKSKQITTRDVAHELGIALKDKDFEQLREAVEKHYEGFNHELLSQCPSLKPGLLSLCHLHLLGLNESEIAALKNLSYSAIKKQNESLQERLGVENDVAAYILRMAEGLCVPQDVPQGVSHEITQVILDLVSHNPKITREEIAHQLGVSSKTVGRYLKKLEGRVRYVGSGYSGHWEVVE